MYLGDKNLYLKTFFMPKVKLRTKPISGDRKSLYLDFYPAIIDFETGELTRRKFLGLYLFDKANTPIDKQHNKETLLLAEKIRQKRDNELNKPEIYSELEKKFYNEHQAAKIKGEKCFVEFFRMLSDKYSDNTYDTWLCTLKHVEKFTGGRLRFAELNETFCNEFKQYLLTANSNKSEKYKLSQNSAATYFSKFKVALKEAYKQNFIQTDLRAKITGIKLTETQRGYLTLKELNSLAQTPCTMPVLKRAALFSALSGLRFSDIEKLMWNEVMCSQEQGRFIQFRQKKTKGTEVLPVSEQAYSLLGEHRKPNDKVFEGLKYSYHTNTHLQLWIARAGIIKDITFHCFRHTYAVLQLAAGTDIFTISKLLGHRELKTTQVYAKIVDKAKYKAVNKIKLKAIKN